MKTLIALLVLSCPVFAGWTYPSLSLLMAQDRPPLDLSPCFVPPGGVPNGMGPIVCPAETCVPPHLLNSINAQFTAACQAFTADLQASYEECMTNTGNQAQCESNYNYHYSVAMNSALNTWQNEIQWACLPCD